MSANFRMSVSNRSQISLLFLFCVILLYFCSTSHPSTHHTLACIHDFSNVRISASVFHSWQNQSYFPRHPTPTTGYDLSLYSVPQYTSSIIKFAHIFPLLNWNGWPLGMLDTEYLFISSLCGKGLFCMYLVLGRIFVINGDATWAPGLKSFVRLSGCPSWPLSSLWYF